VTESAHQKRARKGAKLKRDAERTAEGRSLHRKLFADALREQIRRVCEDSLPYYEAHLLYGVSVAKLPPRWRQRAAYRRSLPHPKFHPRSIRGRAARAKAMLVAFNATAKRVFGNLEDAILRIRL